MLCDMHLSETLWYGSFMTQIATNVVVVGCVMPMYRLYRHRFFAILGLSAMIGVFVNVMFFKLGQQPNDTASYSFIWNALTLISILDFILYAVGISQMVAFFRRKLCAAIDRGNEARAPEG